jgi:D,D-heptose 1,7-bisphosphate phosphatase
MKQAIILAGGKGTRLLEFSKDKPKPMVEIHRKPLIEYQIELCKKYGFEDIHILIHHKGEIIREFLKDGLAYGTNITYHEEEKQRGTAGAVLDIIDHLKEDFLVIYGDTFMDIDLGKFYQCHQDKNNDSTLFLHPNNHPYDSDLVEIDEYSYIKKINKYPHPDNIWYQNLVNAALYVVKKDILLDNFLSSDVIDFAKDLFPQLLQKNKKLYGYISTEYIKDVGTPDRLASVLNDIKSKKTTRLLSAEKKHAIFLDRDGVINKEKGHIKDPNELELIPGVPESIKKINDMGYLSVVITNQAVIARGDCDRDILKNIHNKLETNLGLESAYLDGIFYCPHHPHSGYEGEISELKINCSCRKPKTGLIKNAVSKMNISLKDSWFIGDTTTDILTAKNLNIRNILLRTGYGGSDNKYAIEADYTFADLHQAVTWIFKEHSKTKKEAKRFLRDIIGKRIIFIGGLARSGKSIWAQSIRELLTENNQNHNLICLDGWLVNENNRKKNNSVLDRYNMEAINTLVKEIRKNDRDISIDIPIYDRKLRSLKENKIRCNIKKNNTVIIEGVPGLLLNGDDQNNICSFYIDCDEDTRKKRMHEDYQWRNTSNSEFELLYNCRQSDENPFIEKSKDTANFIVSNYY